MVKNSDSTKIIEESTPGAAKGKKYIYLEIL